MKKMMMVLAFCLMSATIFAGNRQVATTLPAETPAVTLTLDGQKHSVKPTKAMVKEVDENHVQCVVYAGKDHASIVFPVGFDNLMGIGYRVLEMARKINIISEEQWQGVVREYNQLGCRSSLVQ